MVLSEITTPFSAWVVRLFMADFSPADFSPGWKISTGAHWGHGTMLTTAIG